MRRDERAARAALSRAIPGPTAAQTAQIRGAGGVVAFCEQQWPDGKWREVAEADLEAAARLGGRFVCPGDAEWPASLDDLEVAGYSDREEGRVPFGVWMRGPLSLTEVARRAVAIVGTRASTAYGNHVAAELAAGLAERGWHVISGGAYGIDAAAHRGALAAGGPTVSVLAGGIDVLYPRGNEMLLERIATEGLLVSEVPCGCAPMRHRFLRRNRLIAALSAAPVVVEAAVRSGALNTAKHARALGKPVLVVPGPVTSTQSAGCHREARREGSRLVTNAAEIVEEVGPIGELAPEPLIPLTPRDAPSLDDRDHRVLDAVPSRHPVSAYRIADVAHLSRRDCFDVLAKLEQHGLVERVGDAFRLSAAARGGVGGGAT